MATKVVMEALSPTMEEGRLVAWKKREGDPVRTGEPLAEVETDKAVMELVARTDGVLRKILLGEGATVPVSATVAIIGGAEENISALVGTAGERESGSAGTGPAGVAPVAGGPTAGASALPPSGPPVLPPSPGRIKSSPLARRLAAAKGLDLAAVAGTGPGGRIIKRDVESAPVGASAGLAPALPPSRSPAASGDVPLTQIRKTIAKRLTQSLGPVPHFFLTSVIDMERAWEARAELKALGERSTVSFNDIVIKAVALALRQHPAVNAWWLDDRIRYHEDVHIGMAVAVEDGLITPVLRHADRKGLAEIAAEARALADRARARKLTPEEYTGSTFSISNLGMLDIDQFTAVINPPEAGILAVGRISQQPAVVDGQLAARRLLRVTLSCDHRVIDGATGARFLQTVKQHLEQPLAMLL
jgi:pyruvate dehydrogenase E2 component (dihydrolipoamide acetyltransferase)